MSDLAPFVAAALRDKTVTELQEEVRQLKKGLRMARSVEVTGENGTPVYARGRVDKGKPDSNPNLWKVNLRSVTPGGCPLSDLASVEIRVGGGIRHATVSEDGPEMFFDMDEERDTDTTKAVNFCFSDTAGGFWLVCAVNGWPRAQWEPFIREADAESIENLLNLAEEEPTGKTIHFFEISFFRAQVNAFLEKLNIAHESVEDDGSDQVLHLVYDAYAEEFRAHAPNIRDPIERERRSTFCYDVLNALVEYHGLERCLEMLEEDEDTLEDQAGIFLQNRANAASSEEFFDPISMAAVIRQINEDDGGGSDNDIDDGL